MHCVKIKSRQGIYVWGTLFMILICYPSDILANDIKLSELRSKMTEILSLRERLIERQAQAFKLRGQLKEIMMELEEEIGTEKNRLKINSYQAASRSPRIDFNLKLIQKILGYISGLDKKIEYLNIGSEELRFLYRQADDDLKILETVHDIEIDNLVDQINQISKKYQGQDEKLLIDSGDFDLIPPERIWNNMKKTE